MASYFSMAFNLNSSIFLGHSVPSTASLGFPQLHTFWRLKRLVILYVQKHQCVGGTRAGISCLYSYWTCLPFFTSIIGSTELNYIWRKRRTTKLTVALRLRESEIKRMLQRDYGKRRQRSRALPHGIIKGISVSRHIVPVITGDLYLPNTALNKEFFASERWRQRRHSIKSAQLIYSLVLHHKWEDFSVLRRYFG